MKLNAIFLYLSFLLLSFASCQSNKEHSEQAFSFEGPTMGAKYKIVYIGKEIPDLQAKVDSFLTVFNRSINTYDSTSLVSRINRNQADLIDSFNFYLLSTAFTLSKMSNGAYDITVAPLVNAWGFGFNKKDSITDERIQELKSIVGFRNFMINKMRVIKLNPNMMLDYNSIAPGYAADLIAELLEKHGINRYLVDVGGELTAKGLNAQNELWTIGIEKPVESGQQVNDFQRILKLDNRALATSGNYRRVYYQDGKRYAHTIDPRTGYPVQHQLLSATILAPNAMLADALATLCMVVGVEDAKHFIQNLNNVDYYFIYEEDGKLKETWSESLADKLIEVK